MADLHPAPSAAHPLPQPPRPDKRQFRDLRWQSEAEISALQALLSDAVDDWCAGWELAPQGCVQVTRAWEAASAQPQGTNWQPFGCDASGAVVAWLHADVGAQQAALVRALFAGESAPIRDSLAVRPSMAAAVAQQAFESLLAALSSALELQPLSLDYRHPEGELPCAPPATDHRPWSGAVQFQVHWHGSAQDALPFPFSVHLAATALAPKRRRGSPALTGAVLNEISKALHHRLVQVRASLRETSIEIAELISLQPGDVLVTAHPLAQPLAVTSRPAGGGAPFMPLSAGHLGKRDGRMALALVPSSFTAPLVEAEVPSFQPFVEPRSSLHQPS